MCTKRTLKEEVFFCPCAVVRKASFVDGINMRREKQRIPQSPRSAEGKSSSQCNETIT
jgi:hypothetical protein